MTAPSTAERSTGFIVGRYYKDLMGAGIPEDVAGRIAERAAEMLVRGEDVGFRVSQPSKVNGAEL